MKFPFLKTLGPESGWYRVGPLARINTCTLHRHAGGRGGAQGIHGTGQRRPDQRHHVLPLGADDRTAARDRSHQGTCSTTRICRATICWSAGPAARRGRRRGRGPARNPVPPLPRRPERRGHDVQPDRLHHQQQRADEPRRHEGGAGSFHRQKHASPKDCSTTSRWPSGPTTRASPAPRTPWEACR